jgi:hypothetical protein
VKTFLNEVIGWTPVIDAILQAHGASAALVFGRAWRYCQMPGGVCTASLERLADDLGYNERTIRRALQVLVENGFLEDMTPDLTNRPHVYRDTGRASLVGRVEAIVSSLPPETGANLPGQNVQVDKMSEQENEFTRTKCPGTRTKCPGHADKMSTEESIKKPIKTDEVNAAFHGWQVICEQLKLDLSGPVYRKFVEPLTPLRLDGQTLIFHAPSDYIAQMAAARLASTILRLASIYGVDKVEFTAEAGR